VGVESRYLASPLAYEISKFPPRGGGVVTWPLDRKFVYDLNKTKTDTSILYSLCGGVYTPFRTSHLHPFGL